MSKSLDLAAGGAQRVTQTFAGLAALTLAAGGAVTFWLHGQINAAQAAAAALQTEVGSSQQITRRLDDTQAAYKQTYDRIAFLESAVTAKSFVPTLLQQLQTLAAATHLTVSSVHPSPLTTPAAPAPVKNADGSLSAKKAPALPYDTMGVDLSTVGTYADTQTFLYDLTRFPKILSVTQIQMSPGGDSGGKTAPQVTTTLKLTAFVFHEDATTPPAPAGDASPATVVPPAAAPTPAGAAGRATQGAVTATRATAAGGL